jgi:hypothetical protein
LPAGPHGFHSTLPPPSLFTRPRSTPHELHVTFDAPPRNRSPRTGPLFPPSRVGPRSPRAELPLLKICSRLVGTLLPYSRKWTSRERRSRDSHRGPATTTCCESAAVLVVSHHLDGSGSISARGMLHPSRTGFTSFRARPGASRLWTRPRPPERSSPNLPDRA